MFCGVELSKAYDVSSTVYYDGNKKEFSLVNVENTDLFTNLKEMMPGDIKEQEILFKLENIKKNTKLFLKINNDEKQEIFKYINMKIYINNVELRKNNEYIELGTFLEDSETMLKVVVEVPREVGNDIQGLQQEISWRIFVQEENSELVEVPKTYDSSNLLFYIIIMIISFIIIIYCVVSLRKNKNDI